MQSNIGIFCAATCIDSKAPSIHSSFHKFSITVALLSDEFNRLSSAPHGAKCRVSDEVAQIQRRCDSHSICTLFGKIAIYIY